MVVLLSLNKLFENFLEFRDCKQSDVASILLGDI